jgi:hypothetical protein
MNSSGGSLSLPIVLDTAYSGMMDRSAAYALCVQRSHNHLDDCFKQYFLTLIGFYFWHGAA